MLSTLSESCNSCRTRVMGRARCMSQLCDICGLPTRLFGRLQLYKDKAVSGFTW